MKHARKANSVQARKVRMSSNMPRLRFLLSSAVCICFLDCALAEGRNEIVGSVVDTKRGRKVYHVWGGDCTGTAGIFQYSVSLDTSAAARYLKAFYQTD